MKFSVLASGSSGNSIYVESCDGREKVLVDAGLNGKKLAEAMAQIGRCPSQLTGILVSHEHRDHAGGVGVVARRYGIPIYANAGTWIGMDGVIGEIDSDLKFEFRTGDVQGLGSSGFEVESFGVSHDAREAMFFTFHSGGKKLAIVTDTGYVSERVKHVIDNADAFVFECNHDVNMLRSGTYPWHLQQRILGDKGHVSNEDAGITLSEVIGAATRKVFMAHLSRENNYPELARMTLEQTLLSRECPVGSQFFLYDTYPNRATDLIEI